MKKIYGLFGSIVLIVAILAIVPTSNAGRTVPQTTTTRAALQLQAELAADSGNTATATGTGGTSTVTLSKVFGTITCDAITTAAAGTHVMTVTNTLVTAASNIQASVNQNGSTGLPVITSIEPGAGSFVIRLSNLHASAAFNAAPKISFHLVK